MKFKESAEMKLAKSSELTESEAKRLSDSTDNQVRLALSRNPVCPREVLEELVNDKTAYVREAASQAISFLEGELLFHPTEGIKLFISTLENNPGVKIKKVIRLVSATSSKSALGTDSQQTRLENILSLTLTKLNKDVVKLGGNAVIGLQVALNNSQGGSAAFGSSEGVLVVGTAVLAEFDED